ncbi:PQQ-binding-like beta-propeller repeat protein [Opitutia bacterium ISCC 51]|nr:PQQ-binding-like beta-propeller repeat protein [Opitutae bacterium ISCC 51]QXD27612.1 PQQ-binding-like beta-propeller repeat protein [Opitutae bacterium ISCC 52]
MISNFRAGIIFLVLTFYFTLSVSANWPQFRGSDGRSIADGQTLPSSIDPEKPLWKTALPTGHSSPVVWGDTIFLTGFEDMQLIMLCVSRSNGEVLWSLLRPLKELQRYSHEDSSPSVPTPSTDGERVAFLFGDYGLITTDLDGKVIWEKQFIPASYEFGYGASPTLIDGKLLINCDGGIRSGLMCLDFESGKEIWFAERSGKIISYASPFVWEDNGTTNILQAGTAQLGSYNLEDGKFLWEVDNLPVFVCTTPTADERGVYFGAWTTGNVDGSTRVRSTFPEDFPLTDEQASDPEAFFARFDSNQDRKISREELPPSRMREAFNYLDTNASGLVDFEELAPSFIDDDPETKFGRNVFVSIKPGGRGNITDTHVNWEKRKNIPYVSSPLLYQNRLYLVKKGGTVSCLDPSSGVAYYERKRLGSSGEYYASPIGVDNKILIASEPGKLIILKASDEFEILESVDMNESIKASPAIVDNHLYVRTDQHLYAF